MNIQHIIPSDDIQEHMTNSNKPCSCCPHVAEENGVLLVFHNSFRDLAALAMAFLSRKYSVVL